MKKRIINVGLIGLGTVGQGVVKILKSKRQVILKETGLDFRLKAACVRNTRKKRSVSTKGYLLTQDPSKIVSDSKIDQVVELMGGIQPAKGMIDKALKNKKDVISANKALFAEQGKVLFETSKKTGRHLGMEAAVCGGIPVLKGLKEGLASNRILQVYGILNGTCNYILTQMSRYGTSYLEALKEAQVKGYAEQNPKLDVDGTDAAHKLAILARLAFKREFEFSKIYKQGIERITQEDIALAKELGYTIKLLAVAKMHRQGPAELRVHPVLLDSSHLLSNISGVNNGVLIEGDEAGEVLFYGKGAGQKPTASAVVSDMISIGELRQGGKQSNERIFPKASVKHIFDIESRYYVRFKVSNRPGVMGSLTHILGKEGISLASVSQSETSQTKSATVVVLTHRTKEKKLQKSIERISRLKVVKAKPVMIRIEGREGSAV